LRGVTFGVKLIGANGSWLIYIYDKMLIKKLN
jgi:hypothetical protein